MILQSTIIDLSWLIPLFWIVLESVKFLIHSAVTNLQFDYAFIQSSILICVYILGGAYSSMSLSSLINILK